MSKKIVLIDYDAAIGTHADDGQPSGIRPGAKEAIHELRSNNYEVHVYSTHAASTADVEKMLKDGSIEYDKVVTMPEFSIIVSPDAVRGCHDWKWTLEEIVLHKDHQEEKKNLGKEMHDAMSNYLKMAKSNEKDGCIVCG